MATALKLSLSSDQIANLFSIAHDAKSVRDYRTANYCFALLLREALRNRADFVFQLETDNTQKVNVLDVTEENLRDELYHDLAVLRWGKEYICIPLPILSQVAIKFFLMCAARVPRLTHARAYSTSVPSRTRWFQIPHTLPTWVLEPMPGYVTESRSQLQYEWVYSRKIACHRHRIASRARGTTPLRRDGLKLVVSRKTAEYRQFRHKAGQIQTHNKRAKIYFVRESAIAQRGITFCNKDNGWKNQCWTAVAFVGYANNAWRLEQDFSLQAQEVFNAHANEQGVLTRLPRIEGFNGIYTIEETTVQRTGGYFDCVETKSTRIFVVLRD